MTTLKVSKAALVSAVRDHVQKEMGVPASSQRLWLWHRRQNSTFRPSNIVGSDMDSKQLTDLKDGGRVRVLVMSGLAVSKRHTHAMPPPFVSCDSRAVSTCALLFLQQIVCCLCAHVAHDR